MKTAAIIIGVVLLILAVLSIRTVWHDSKLMAKESSQRALVAETCALMEKHRSENGRYPETLTALPLTYPDGGSAELLKDMTYTCVGTSYTLKTVGYSSGRTIEIKNGAEQRAAPLPPAPQTGPSDGVH